MHKLPLFGAFHALAIDEAGCGAGFARGFLSALDVEHMMDAIQRAIPVLGQSAAAVEPSDVCSTTQRLGWMT